MKKIKILNLFLLQDFHMVKYILNLLVKEMKKLEDIVGWFLLLKIVIKDVILVQN